MRRPEGDLRPLMTGADIPTTLVRPVSRVSFSLTDTDAFEKSAQFAIDWLSDKVGGPLPEAARNLASFDTQGVDGLHPCHAARLDDHTGSIWAARIDEPGSNPRAGETWSTELFVERPVGGLVRFCAQLMARRPAGSAELKPSRPRLVYDLICACFAKGSVDILDAAWILALREEGQVSTTLIAENMSAAFKGRRRLRPRW